jgi:hypothetical protein
MNGQSAPSQMLHGMTFLAFVIHIAGGEIGLVSGTIAVFARKGGYLHRKAGSVFVASKLVMAMLAVYLGFALPDEITNVFIGTFALYLGATAWMTVRRSEGASGFFEKFALIVGLCLCAPFAILTLQLAAGLPPLFPSAVPFKGPALIAIYAYDRARPRGDRRCQGRRGRQPLGRVAHFATSVAYVPQAHVGRGFGFHERIRAATARSPSSAG